MQSGAAFFNTTAPHRVKVPLRCQAPTPPAVTMLSVGSGFSPTKKVRMFAGYAGWSPGQLEDEMKRGAWVTHPASLELVFNIDPQNLWKKILREKNIFRAVPIKIPDRY